MKAILINFFLLTALLSLVSCGSSKQDVGLQVSTAFSLSSAGFRGGLIAYGENTKGERFSISASEGQTLSLKLENETWKIFVVGWDDTNNLKFRGTKYCGSTSIKLETNTTDIDVKATTANCSSADFQSETSIQNLLISSCGGFYKYNTAGDSYSPITAADGDSFCSQLPSNLSYGHPYYKLVSTDIKEKISTNGMSTECLATNPTTGIRLSVPTKKFPFSVQMFRSLKDCQTTAKVGFADFAFPKGIADGNQPSFDQHFLTNAAYEGHLFLPSSSTRRGYSPFMNNQPRIRCGDADCFASPALPNMTAPLASEKVNFDIRWDDYYQDGRAPVLIKNFKTSNVNNACDSTTLNFLNSSPYFSAQNCKIERGDLQAKLARNAFTCRGNADMGNMYDIYEKNNNIFLVNKYGTYNFKVMVYSKFGVLLNEIQIPSVAGDNYKSMTVDPTGTVYVLMSAASTVKTLHKFSQSGNSSYTSVSYAFLANYEKIEAVGNGLIVGATNTNLQAFKIVNSDPSTLSAPSIMAPIPSATTIKKLLYKDNFLYALNSDGSNSKIHAASVNNDTLAFTFENAGSPVINAPSLTESFHIGYAGTQKYLLLTSESNPATVKVFPLTGNSAGTMAATFNMQSAGWGSIFIENSIHILQGSSSSYASLSAWKFNPGNSTIVSAQNPTIDRCEAQLSETIDSTQYKLNIASRRNNAVKTVFEEAFRNIGRHNLTSPEVATYFDNLSDGDDENDARSEGLLKRASKMMGPDGIGGVLNGLFPNKTCLEIQTLASSVTAGSVAGINTSFVLKDYMKNESRTYAISITDPAMYDLAIQISSPGVEKLLIQLNCSDKIGSFESVNLEDGQNKRELTIWNTNSSTSANYENYEIEDRIENNVNRKRINISILKKTDENNLIHRYVEINRTPSFIDGRVSEMFVSGSNIASSSINTNSLPIADFNISNVNLSGSFQIQAIVSNDKLLSLMPDAGACMANTNTDPAANNETCPNQPHSINQTSVKSDLDFNLASLKGYTDGTGASAQFYTIFSLSP